MQCGHKAESGHYLALHSESPSAPDTQDLTTLNTKPSAHPGKSFSNAKFLTHSSTHQASASRCWARAPLPKTSTSGSAVPGPVSRAHGR